MLDNSTSHNSNEYDNKVIKTIPFYKHFHSETIDLIKTIKPDVNSWLDTGCGTGYLIYEAFLIFPNCIFYLADPSIDMLNECKKRLNKNNLDRVVFLNPVDSENIEKEITQKVEIITSIQSHHYLKFDERKNALKSCYNMLQNNGLYITFENIKPLTEAGINIGLDRWMRFQMESGRSQEIVNDHRKRFDNKYFPINIYQHIDLLKKCGYKIVELFWYSHMQAGFYAIK